MQPRQLLIVAGVAIVAFAAAFGIAGASGGGESKAASAGIEPAEVLEVGDATVTARVTAAAGLPPLQVPVKKKKEPKPPASSGGDTTTTPPPSTPPSTPPPSTPPSTPPPSTPPSTPPSSPPPSSPPPSTGGDGPISTGGGED